MGNLGGLLHDECPSSTRQARPSYQNTHSKVLNWQLPRLDPLPAQNRGRGVSHIWPCIGQLQSRLPVSLVGGWGGGGVF